MNKRELVDVWVIYDRLEEIIPGFPFVARKWVSDNRDMSKAEPTNTFLVGETIEKLRAKLPEGIMRITCLEGKTPGILEVWL